MVISDGENVDAAASNAAWMSRKADTNSVGKVDLENVDSASGASVINTQREINSLNSFTGRVSGSAHNAKPNWATNNVGLSTDNLEERSEALDAKFDETSGHAHDGTAGSGVQIDASTLGSFNNYFAAIQTFNFTGAAGSDDDISTEMTGKVAGGGTSSEGVPTSAPHNRAEIRNQSTGDQLEDSGGQKIYGRITESSGTWTLTYYTNEAGVETAASLSSTNITVYFKEVFNAGTRPTFDDATLEIGSLDYTADIVDASATQRGAVSTGAQVFAGVKTLNDAPNMEGGINLKEIAAPGTPASGYSIIYVKTDGMLYIKDDAGLETQVGSGGGLSNPIANNSYIQWRNAANSADIDAIKVDATDILRFQSGGNGNNGVEFEKHAGFVDNQLFIQDGNAGDIYPYDSFPVPSGVDLAVFVRYFNDSSYVYFGSASSDAEMDAASNGTSNVRYGSGDNADGSTMDSPRHTGDVLCKTGDNPNGTGRTGNWVIETGTPDSGTRGYIALRDGTEGTAGHVWTSTGTAGEGAWAPSSGSASADGADGSIQFATSGAFDSDANLFWDDTNKYMGVGTNTPSNPLHVVSATNSIAPLLCFNSDSSGQVNVAEFSSNGNTALLLRNTGGATNGMFIGNSGGATADWQFANLDSGGQLIFYASGLARLSIDGSANIVFNPTTSIEFSKKVANNFAIQSGTTGSRPASPATGQHYFDTSLAAGAGKPIWYNGTNWVDATGATV